MAPPRWASRSTRSSPPLARSPSSCRNRENQNVSGIESCKRIFSFSLFFEEKKICDLSGDGGSSFLCVTRTHKKEGPTHKRFYTQRRAKTQKGPAVQHTLTTHTTNTPFLLSRFVFSLSYLSHPFVEGGGTEMEDAQTIKKTSVESFRGHQKKHTHSFVILSISRENEWGGTFSSLTRAHTPVCGRARVCVCYGPPPLLFLCCAVIAERE